MKIVYVSKNSWWDERKARKVLLPLALSGLAGVSVLLVNAARPLWKRLSQPRCWQHPETGMLVLTPIRLLPMQRFALVRRLNQWVRWHQICGQVAKLPATERRVVCFILSDPEDTYLADLIRKAGYRCHFDWTEKWDVYAKAAGSEAQSRLDANGILAHVDGVIAVSAELADEAGRAGLPCLHLPNAVSDAFRLALQQQKSDEPELLQAIPSPRLVHVGSYNPNWIHWDWLIHAAKVHPEVSFCMLGGGGEHDVPALPANVHLLGRVRYEEIPAYLQHVDGCLLLYRVEATSAGDPTKLYEYLASGLPIVASPHPRCLEFTRLVHVADTQSGFSDAIKLALNEDKTLSQGRVMEAGRHTWRLRAEELIRWVAS